MADFGDTDPLLEHNDDDDDDDDDEGDTTTPFQPDKNSTPGPSGEEIPMTTMNREQEKGSKTAETSFIEGDIFGSRVLTSNENAWESLTTIFPEAKASELEVSYSKKGRLQVKMFGQGKKTYPLFTEERGTNEQRLNPSLSKEIKKSLGPEREVLIAQKDEEIEKLQQSIQDDRDIADDENENPAIRERARERIAENQEQIDALENERERLEERLSLRERVRNIFKKYGFTVSAVVLAVGTTIGVIVSTLTKGLKTVAKGVGNGLKTLGKKIAGILPGLIGSIVGFVFRAAGSVISFLGQNAWVLIMGVAIFMVERFQNKRR